MDPEYFEKRWEFIVKHPLLCFAFIIIGWFSATLFYSERVNLADERVRYANFDNVENMKRSYEADVQRAIESAKELKVSSDCVWAKPICPSFDDKITSGLARQVVLHNEVYAHVCPEADLDFCKKLELPFTDNKMLWPPEEQGEPKPVPAP